MHNLAMFIWFILASASVSTLWFKSDITVLLSWLAFRILKPIYNICGIDQNRINWLNMDIYEDDRLHWETAFSVYTAQGYGYKFVYKVFTCEYCFSFWMSIPLSVATWGAVCLMGHDPSLWAIPAMIGVAPITNYKLTKK